MIDEPSAQIPGRGPALTRMLISLLVVGTALGYWATRLHRPADSKLLLLMATDNGAYYERSPSEDTPAHRQEAESSLYPTVREWLDRNTGRARRLGAPIATHMDDQYGDQIRQWVRFSGGRALTFYSNAGAIYVIREDDSWGRLTHDLGREAVARAAALSIDISAADRQEASCCTMSGLHPPPGSS